MALLLGLLLGMRHALDADHVLAVTTIVTRERSFARAARVGLWWGVGHTLTIFLVGGAIIVFRWAVAPGFASVAEFGVAIMLIALGARTLARVRDDHAPPAMTPLLTGSVHGLAGSAALALLVLAAIPDTAGGLLYLGVFGAGTVAGMVLVTAAIAGPTLAAFNRVRNARRIARVAAGTLSVVFGLGLAFDIATQHPLRSDSAHVTPR